MPDEMARRFPELGEWNNQSTAWWQRVRRSVETSVQEAFFQYPEPPFKVTDGILELNNVKVTGTLIAGEIVLGEDPNDAGPLRSSGATAFDAGVGIFADVSGGIARWRVGDPSGRRLSWDGSQLILSTGTGDDNFAASDTGLTYGNLWRKFYDNAVGLLVTEWRHEADPDKGGIKAIVDPDGFSEFVMQGNAGSGRPGFGVSVPGGFFPTMFTTGRGRNLFTWRDLSDNAFFTMNCSLFEGTLFTVNEGKVSALRIDMNQLGLHDGGQFGTLSASLSASRTWTLPNTSGTVAVTFTGTGAPGSGVGVPLSWYLDTAANELYFKADATTWILVA
jgi:hypothetical protein